MLTQVRAAAVPSWTTASKTCPSSLKQESRYPHLSVLKLECPHRGIYSVMACQKRYLRGEAKSNKVVQLFLAGVLSAVLQCSDEQAGIVHISNVRASSCHVVVLCFAL